MKSISIFMLDSFYSNLKHWCGNQWPLFCRRHFESQHLLTHWGRVTQIFVSKLTIIDSDNGLSPGRRQAIIWTNVEILLIEPLETNVSEISIKIYTFSFKKSIWKCRLENGSHLVSVSMCWNWTGDTSLPEPMMEQSTEACMRHIVLMC